MIFTDDYVSKYIEIHGSFDSMGYDLNDKVVINACRVALEQNRKIKTSDLYPEGVDV